MAYQAFLGGQYGDDGVQLRWVAPTAMFLEVGGELLRGQNFPGGGTQHGGVGTLFVLAATGGLLLPANNPQAGEHLKDLLVEQCGSATRN